MNVAIFMILNINIFMEVLLPTLLSVYYSFSIERQLNISNESILQVIILNAIYHLFFFITFLFVVYKPKSHRDVEYNQYEKLKFNFVFFIFILIGIYILATTSNYENIAREISGTVEMTSFNIYLKTMFEYISWGCAIIFLFTYKKNLWLKILVLMFCLSIVLRQLAIGLRGGIFITIMFVIFVSLIVNRKINFKLITLLLIIVIPVFGFLGGEFRDSLYNSGLNKENNIERLKVISNEFIANTFTRNKTNTNNRSEKEKFSYQLYSRLQATRNSVSLIKLHDNGKSAGLKPTINSINALVPGRFLKDKQYPGSINDSYNGTAMYIVRAQTYGTSDMGPYLASAHEYWEGGFFYLLFSSIILGLLWGRLSNWSKKRNFDTYSLIILVSILDAHHGEMTVLSPLSSIIRLFWYQILPFIILTFIIINIENMMIKRGIKIRI